MKPTHQPAARRLFVAALLMAASSAWVGAMPARAAPLGVNLIVNGDGEADVGAPSNSQVVKPTGWRTTGDFTVVQYGASGGFPDDTSPGPDDRGKNFFAGGNQPLSTASQSIDLAPYAAAIAGGHLGYTLSGWLGGYADQGDNTVVRVTFKDAAGRPVGAPAVLGPVTPGQRNNVSGLLRRTAAGVVPPAARSAAVLVTITRLVGQYNDGSADDLSLVLK